jgi:hypothetical protein
MKYNFQYPITFKTYWTTISKKDRRVFTVLVALLVFISVFSVFSLLFFMEYDPIPPDNEIGLMTLLMLIVVLIYPLPTRILTGIGGRIHIFDMLMIYTSIMGIFYRPIWYIAPLMLAYMPMFVFFSIRAIIKLKLSGTLDKLKGLFNAEKIEEIHPPAEIGLGDTQTIRE